MTGDRTPVRRPGSTYRLQFHGGFGFADAASVIPYLRELGVTDFYSSPYLTARPGSTHGYDICDHNRLNPELGTREEYEAFTSTLAACGMGQLLDFVPNHMGVDPRTNPWWRDVLENGPSSPYARFFDIDWEPVKPELRKKVLLPVLGDQYGRVLERGELQLAYADGVFELTYFDNRLPINPRRATEILRYGLDDLRFALGDDNPHVLELLSIVTALHNLPPYTETDPERVAERQREKEVARGRLQRLVDAKPAVGEHIQRALRAFNGTAGRRESFDLLHDLLEAQAYRLSYWRTASHEINYRRFFDINDLAGLRMEDPEVFDATHALLRSLLAERKVTGVRVDHPDGLFSPARYFEQLQQLAHEAWADRDPGGATRSAPLYLAVEKILSGREQLVDAWPVHGTTGYSFANDVTGVFVDGTSGRTMRRIYGRLTGRRKPFDEVVYESKKLIMETAMASELNVLARALNRLSERNRRSRDFTLYSLRDVLTEVVAFFPVYRTYVDESGWTLNDRQTIEIAVKRARRRSPAMEATIFDFVREALLPRPGNGSQDPDHDRRDGYAPADEEEYTRRLEFAMKLQQYTGPVQAKGLEDTAFYRYNLLLSLNEVGGDPARFGRSVADFHAANRLRLERLPYEMLATATHDTKLGEDVRARINVLSELPEEWGRAASRWMRLNAAHRSRIDNEPAPDRNDEYRFYQVLLGAWPADISGPEIKPTGDPTGLSSVISGTERPVSATGAPRGLSPVISGTEVRPAGGTGVPAGLVERLVAYMRKATKEAKVYTSWINDNRAYDEAVASFVKTTLTGPNVSKFLASFLPFQRKVAAIGMINSLAQLVLKLTSPGTPDFYQGTELWDLNLVDPDNRRPVDFELRRRLLEGMRPLVEDSAPDAVSAVTDMLQSWPDGRIKLYVTARGLRLRRELQDLFQEGEYVPLDADITAPSSIVAFARRHAGRTVLAIVPRLVAKITTPDLPMPIGAEAWKTSRVFLPPDFTVPQYVSVFTGETVRPMQQGDQQWLFVGDVFRTCPVALLTGS